MMSDKGKLSISGLVSSRWCLPLMAALGVILLVLPTLLGRGETIKESRAEDELDAYRRKLEEGFCSLVSQVEGAGHTTVFVTLESSFENVYASDASVNEATNGGVTDKKSEKQLVFTNDGKANAPIVVKRIPPKIRGVAIVCEGGNNEKVRREITSLAATTFNITANRIYVTGGT